MTPHSKVMSKSNSPVKPEDVMSLSQRYAKEMKKGVSLLKQKKHKKQKKTSGTSKPKESPQPKPSPQETSSSPSQIGLFYPV